MRKILILLFVTFILSGCATYKFQKPNATGEGSQGYLASYNGDPILEYTVGKDKSLPDLTLAKERFKRRRAKVEYYYKKMDLIESRVKEVFWEPPAMMVDFLWGVLRWPVIAVKDYKYHRNLKYQERVDKLDEQKEELEKARIAGLREKLAVYITEDLAKEPALQDAVVAAPAAPKSQPEALPHVPQITSEPVVKPIPVAPIKPVKKIKPPVVKPPVIEKVLMPPVAVITAKPEKGFSPLMVKFSGKRSTSKNGKIVAYNWDFGDGDTSTKANSENIYYSTTYGVRNFTVTLTVKDAAGLTSSTTSAIEVSTY